MDRSDYQVISVQYCYAFMMECAFGNVRVLLVCFTGIAFSSLETWPVSELKVASGKPKGKHCSIRISQEQEEKENSKTSRPIIQTTAALEGSSSFFFLLE